MADVQAKAYLQKTDANGVSLYDHLVELVYKTLEANPNNVANNVKSLPNFSHDHKKNAFRPHNKRTDKVYAQSVEPDSRVVGRASEVKELFDTPPPLVKTTVEHPTPNVTVTTTTVKPKKAPVYRSVAHESRYFQLVGVGLPQQEALLIDLSITKLASEKKLSDVRFFGKIFGMSGDYIIVESARWYPDKDHKNYVEKNVMPDPPRKKLPVDVQLEPMGKGLNRYSYWVCSYANAPWTHLPDVTPQQLNSARLIKKYFTGDLDATINSYPAFPGKEINYLRAQIARIASASQISPAGALNKHEDEEEEEEDEEEEEGAPKKPREEKTRPLTDPAEEAPELEEGIKSLANAENWVHHYQYVYKTGRATKVPEKEVNEDEEAEEEEEEEEPKKEEEEKELLEPIAKDKLYDKIIIPKPEEPTEEGEEPEEKEEEEPKEEEEEKDEDEEEEEGEEEDPFKKRIPPWVLKLKNALYKNHGVVMVKSLRWPGAFSYAAEGGKVWGNAYMGNGLKATSRQFAPTPASEIMKEVDDLREKEDPTAMTEKLLLRGEELPEKDDEDEPDDEGEEGEGEDED